MSNKKECSCGYWNKEQEECLYSGHGCAKDIKEDVHPIVGESFVRIYVKMIKEDPHQCTRENLIGMLREAGVEVIID